MNYRITELLMLPIYSKPPTKAGLARGGCSGPVTQLLSAKVLSPKAKAVCFERTLANILLKPFLSGLKSCKYLYLTISALPP